MVGKKPKEPDRTPVELANVLKSTIKEVGNYLGEDAEESIDQVVQALRELDEEGREEE